MDEKPDSDDVLSREVSIKAGITDNGIEFATKSRFAAAMDRLLGSMADWPSSFFEGKAAKRRLNDEIERRVLEAKADVVVKRIGSQDSTVIELQAESVRKLENRAGVAYETYEELKRLPPPPAQEGQPNGETADGATFDDDWMNAFIRYAEDASSEQLQQLWGRVLGGEIRRPGSFSRRTLRFMADLDKDVAMLCESVAGLVFQQYIMTGEKWHGGAELEKALALQALGLVSGVGGLVSYSLPLNATGEAVIMGRKAIITFKGDPNASVAFNALKLTELGREVFSLLSEPDELTLLRDLASLVDKSHLESITVGLAVRTGTNSARVMTSDEVYRRPQSPPEG